MQSHSTGHQACKVCGPINSVSPPHKDTQDPSPHRPGYFWSCMPKGIPRQKRSTYCTQCSCKACLHLLRCVCLCAAQHMGMHTHTYVWSAPLMHKMMHCATRDTMQPSLQHTYHAFSLLHALDHIWDLLSKQQSRSAAYATPHTSRVVLFSGA